MPVVIFAWTDERVALLKERWDEGASAAKIAAEFGAPVTRNAVVGKLHRLGLQRNVRPISAVNPSPARRAKMVAVVVRVQAPAAAQPIVVEPPSEPPPPGYLELHELEPQHCRWPAGEGADTRFCGEPRVEREVNGTLCPYCAWHASLAYMPPRTARQLDGVQKRRETMARRRAA